MIAILFGACVFNAEPLRCQVAEAFVSELAPSQSKQYRQLALRAARDLVLGKDNRPREAFLFFLRTKQQRLVLALLSEDAFLHHAANFGYPPEDPSYGFAPAVETVDGLKLFRFVRSMLPERDLLRSNWGKGDWRESTTLRLWMRLVDVEEFTEVEPVHTKQLFAQTALATLEKLKKSKRYEPALDDLIDQVKAAK